MSGGGGGGSLAPVAPVYTDPTSGRAFDTTTALNDEIAQREAEAKAKSDADAATAAQTVVDDRNKFNTNLSTARNNATTSANQYFTDNGYDPNDFATQLANAINMSASKVPDLAPAPGAAFDPNLGATILGQVSAGKQSQAMNSISSLFGPTYAADHITDDWITPAATSALSAQFDPLTEQLTNSFKRGTLNDTGYAAAQRALEGKRTTAMSTVNNLGANILANDRNGLDNYITVAKNDAANVNAKTFSSFDPTRYSSGASSLVDRNKNSFSGDLLNSIGSTSFADLPSLLNAGGAVQGATDPSATNPNGGGGPSDSYIAQQALDKKQRGLGSQGAF